MKRIAIFIDGTWNRPDAEHPTNVLRLARCVNHGAPDGTHQHVIYSPGVGSGIGNNRLARRMDRVLGGALGWGLTDIIADTYRNLVFSYEPGDELFVFGFSRGAFAARSLVGLIRSCGIAPRRHLNRLPEALARYISRTPAYHPEDPSSYEFRADFAPDTATSAREFQWRRGRGDQAILLDIPYLGVWDTVSALGLPAFVPMAKTFNAQYSFHDADLSSSVLSARHAISIDERRRTFPAHPWKNLSTLTANRQAREGEAVGQPYLQQWFPGDHGSVGGGGSRVGLSSVALHWIALGAEAAGLSLSWEEFDRIAPQFDPVGTPLTNKFGPVGLSGLVLSLAKANRIAPETVEDVSLAALDRLWSDEGYRPWPLRRLRDAIRAMTPEERAALRAECHRRDGGATHRPGSLLRPRKKGGAD
jgi:uncharacterized protein (DUF2235 family)